LRQAPLESGRADPSAGASLKTELLNAPEGVPILYTDSNSLLTLAAKPVAAQLPAAAYPAEKMSVSGPVFPTRANNSKR
jgi:hypothetical protein